MTELGLRFLGVGNAFATSLGTSAAVLEAANEPLLLIDCGPETLSRYVEQYDRLPEALFITHAHFDHVGGLEGLFYRLATAPTRLPLLRLYMPVTLAEILQRRLADYHNLLAEGGLNFWDVFQLVLVSERFWHRDLNLTVFPVRHHEHRAAFGLALEGRFLFTGDTRPIPELINLYGTRGEPIFHDCCTIANPSHTGIDDLFREYKEETRRRMILYHYESTAAGRLLEERGFRIARAGERYDLPKPSPAPNDHRPEMTVIGGRG